MFIEDTDSDGNIMTCVKHYSALHTDLKAFLQFTTRCPVPIGQVVITVEDDEGADVISANTC